MVNSKPPLIFGGAQDVRSPARTKPGRVSSRPAENFSSYLPGINTAAKSAIPPSASPDTQKAAPGRAPGGRGQGAIVSGAASVTYPRTVDLLQGKLSRSAPPVSQPAGQVSRADARAQARPGDPGMAASHARNGFLAQSGYMSVKNPPRIATDRPITGRGNFGGVETRAVPQANSTLVGRGALNYAAPAARAKNDQAARPEGVFVASLASESGLFGGFSPYRGDPAKGFSQQSFVTHGFAGKNAEIALKRLGYDVRETRNIATRAVRLDQEAVSHAESRPPASGTTFGSVRPVRREDGEDAARIAVQTEVNKKRKIATPEGGASFAPSPGASFRAAADDGLGFLAAKFESGEEGIAAIGYDGRGGTSYGKYQISSRVGTMRAFLEYLEIKAPDLSRRLKAAGPANTGGRSGKMPSEWRKIAAEEPERFEALQSEFIRTSHFEPALQAIASATGVAFEKLPSAYQEVLFSTAVQHGSSGATRIISQALQRVEADKLQNQKSPSARKTGEKLISHIYRLRADQFVSSTSRVQAAVRNRLQQEMSEVVRMI